MDTTLMLLSNGGLIFVGAYLIYYFTKKYSEQQRFIQEKLLKAIENNTKVMEQLIMVINEMRHEIKENFDRLERKINGIGR